MTTRSREPATTALSGLVWPVAVSADEAVRTVARRLPDGAGLTARLYHHPFLGLTFLLDKEERRSWWRTATQPVLAAVVVDLVSGRAFVTDPWNAADLTTRTDALPPPGPVGATTTPAPRDPAPRHTEAEAIEAGRALLPGLLARRRRLDALGPAELTGPPVSFGKPNWWVTGRAGGRTVEVVVDALSGRHYVRTA